MINETKLELLCIQCILADDYIEGNLSKEEHKALVDRYLDLKKEFIEQYVTVPAQK